MFTKLSEFIKEKWLPPDERALNLLEVRPWYPVRLLALYRLFIAVLLSSFFFSGVGRATLGSTDPVLFANSAIVYLLLTILWFALIRLRWPSYTQQVYFQISSDIALIVLMMHASGGLSSGLAMLLVINVAGATLLVSGIAGLMFAAISTLLVMFEQFYTHITTGPPPSSYPQVGAMGAAFFGVSLLMLILKRRVQESERLVEQREIDIENLAQLNEQIIQHIQSGVIVVDADLQVRLINRSAKMQLGISEIQPPTPLDELSTELASRFGLWQSGAQETPSRIRSPGSPFELQPHFTPLGKEGQAGTLVVLEDTTPYSREFQNIKLASLGRLTASIAHEIRNPLSAIQHAAQLLSESQTLEQHDQRLTQIIAQQTHRVNTIIETVLQLSIKEKTTPVQINLQNWIQEFTTEFLNQYDNCEIKTRINTSEAIAYFDPTQLQQILWNLCTNSVKYGYHADGRVNVELIVGHDKKLGNIFLDIADFGVGIADNMRDNVFEPFYSSGSTSPGLGLYIVRELCEFNHAQIRYIDKPEYGAVFRIQFSNPLKSHE